jgi:hypothetical protein
MKKTAFIFLLPLLVSCIQLKEKLPFNNERQDAVEIQETEDEDWLIIGGQKARNHAITPRIMTRTGMYTIETRK